MKRRFFSHKNIEIHFSAAVQESQPDVSKVIENFSIEMQSINSEAKYAEIKELIGEFIFDDLTIRINCARFECLRPLQ